MEINEKIEQWYQVHQRDLPFRRTKDPYAIWVSEIMAQQTRIDTMIPYYEKWMNKWPTIEALANADLEEILHEWQGLGYYNRARKLLQGAIEVENNFNGEIPRDLELIKRISGIGEYTAGAICSIAFNLPTPAVDGNVFRVVMRYFALDADITKTATRKMVTDICQSWIDKAHPSDFTQGLMEIGAMVCTPKKPTCLLCPLMDMCEAYKKGTQELYPVKKKAKAPKEKYLYTKVIQYKDLVFLCRDSSDGLMEGYWRLPQFERDKEVKGKIVHVEKRKHVFSHLIWFMDVVMIEATSKKKVVDGKWVKISDLGKYPMVTAHRKILDDCFKDKI